MKQTIFLGGCYTAEHKTREKIAQTGRKIEDIIRDCGYEPSLNLLSNPKVDNKSKDPRVALSSGESFIKVGNKVIAKYPRSKIELIKSLRDVNHPQGFETSFMASNIALSEAAKSIAGIFELSSASQGSYMEIGLLLFHFQVPVLALTNKNEGRYFGTMLTGCPSPLLICREYTEKSLPKIVRDFITIDLPNRKVKQINFKVPQLMVEQIKAAAEKHGYRDISKFIRQIVEHEISKDGHIEEPARQHQDSGGPART